ncbi:hypothetical protein GETHPA_15080 [Geothrix rubra]|uniref:Aminopeptidase n=1 Tax=Geothrix rubra TaxID=2927977 RepID=A0ABQ5Q6D8_9BACT|nr:hypothetical protein [Geothrix rubra]GLH69975.1 hypothetical protein GETHPA_15080 [Geothrix rubra]
MKRWVGSLCLGLLSWGICLAAHPFKGHRWVQTARQAMMEFLDVASTCGNPELAKRAVAVRHALESNRIHIQIPPDDPGTPLSGAEFFLDREQRPTFLLKTRFLALYPGHRAFVFAVLMHETTHANAYLDSPTKFFSQREQGVERYLYEMDAAYLEASFLRDVARPKGWKLSPFESYLLESLDHDNLASYSTAFQVTDMEFVYTFVRARKGPESLAALASEFVAQGRAMKAAFLQCNRDDAWGRYKALVSIRTFVAFGSELAATLVAHKRPGTDPHDTIDQHIPGFDAVILDLQATLDKERDALGFRDRLMKRMNTALETP